MRFKLDERLSSKAIEVVRPPGAAARGPRGRHRQAHPVRGLPPDQPRRHRRHGRSTCRRTVRSTLAGALSVRDNDEIMLLTAKGQSIRCPVKDIRETGSRRQGRPARFARAGRQAPRHRPDRRARDPRGATGSLTAIQRSGRDAPTRFVIPMDPRRPRRRPSFRWSRDAPVAVRHSLEPRRPRRGLHLAPVLFAHTPPPQPAAFALLRCAVRTSGRDCDRQPQPARSPTQTSDP